MKKRKSIAEARAEARARVAARGGHILAPSDQTLPRFKAVVEEGGAWHSEPDGVEPLLNPDAGPGSQPCPASEHERQMLEWLALARCYSTNPECVAAVKSLQREYQRQIAELQRWRRRTDFVRECWAREYQAQREKSPRRDRQPLDPNQPVPITQLDPTPLDPAPLELPPTLLKPRQGERNAIDPRLMRWAGDVGRHIMAQSDSVAALALLLNKKRPANRPTVNTERDQEIRSFIALAKDKGIPLQNAFKAAALAWDLSKKQVREIYYGGPRASRHLL